MLTNSAAWIGVIAKSRAHDIAGAKCHKFEAISNGFDVMRLQEGQVPINNIQQKTPFTVLI
jgi:hypothetical protein